MEQYTAYNLYKEIRRRSIYIVTREYIEEVIAIVLDSYYTLRKVKKMFFWFIVGFIVWILCILFMLAIIKGGHRIRGHGYEQKLYLRSIDKNQNREDSIEKEVEDCVNK